MTAANIEASLGRIFGHEGGYSNDPDDPGNWSGGSVGHGQLLGTKFGIAANSYPHIDIRHLTIADAAEIYRRDYASKVKFNQMPDGLDHAMLDFAINSGPSRAAKFLQRILRVPDDGRIGPFTLAEVSDHTPIELINQLCDARLAYLHKLGTWKKYGRGWARRVEEVRAFALELAGKA